MRVYPAPKRTYVSFDPKANYRRLVKEHVAFVASLKEGRPCADCSGMFPAVCLEFDHVRGEKKYSVGRMRNHRREAILEEVAKCELICCICHRIRTHVRRPVVRTYKDQHMLKRNLAFHAWMQQLKKAPCTDCGKTFPSVAMDWDHVRGVKVKSVSQMWGWSRTRILDELAKCELTCANCHRIRTADRLVKTEHAAQAAA